MCERGESMHVEDRCERELDESSCKNEISVGMLVCSMLVPYTLVSSRMVF